MKKRHPLHDYIVAQLAREGQPVKLTKSELDYACRENYSIVLTKDYVELAVSKKPRSIMPFEQRFD